MTFSDIEIKKYNFKKDTINKVRDEASIAEFNWAVNWPTIYIINNDKTAYVGESYKIKNRIEQHLKNKKKQDLKIINIILDKKANKSYTLDIESSLIRYMSADRKFRLQNGNDGLVDYDYFDKEKYHEKFKKVIWPMLKKEGLVKHNLQEIENSALFKFSPYTSLSSDQYDIVDEILELFNEQNIRTTGNVIINGGPGTGKSLLAIYLIKLLSLSDENFEDEDVKNQIKHVQQFTNKIGLVVPQGSFRKTLKEVFKEIDGLKPEMVLSPNEVFNKYYDLLIVDEAHRLRQRKNLSNYGSYDEINRKHGFDKKTTELDWIISQSKYQILFYDKGQTVKPTDISYEYFQEKTDYSKLNEYRLYSQFRVNAGGDYLNYISKVLSSDQTKKINFRNYDLRLFKSFKDIYGEIKKRNDEIGMCRIVSGYGWDWKSKKDKSKYDIEIEGIRLIWNSTLYDWINKIDSVDEVGCIHTIQGYDLNYTAVIFGPEISYDKNNNKIKVDKKKYFDRNGKAGIYDEKRLTNYVKNIYSVLMTRGIKGTYIYAYDKDLHDYLKQFFDVV